MTQSTAAFKRGWDARKQGVVVGDNPFDEKDELHWEWMRGWTASAAEQKETA